MILHKDSNALFMDSKTHFNVDSYEIEANKFAMELLISDEILEENKEFTIEQVCRMLGYHEKLIRLRLQ